MNENALSLDWLYQVKAATRDLIRHAGGLVRAGELTGFGKSTIGRWGQTDQPDTIPISAVLILERETGTAFVTAIMAGVNGRTVTERAEAAPADLMQAVARAAKEGADVLSATAAAMADGVITPNEARTIERETDEAREAYTDLQRATSAAGGQALKVV